MAIKLKFLSILPLSMILSACVHSYTSPEYQKYRASDLKIPTQPFAARIEAEFFRNGQPLPAVIPQVKRNVVQTLRRTHVIEPSDNAEHTFKISANNVADLGDAVRKGFGTGLTFGLAGNTVQDNYEVSCSYLDRNKVLHTENYQHAIASTVGNASPPAGMLAHPNLNAAFSSVMDDVVINCLGYLQKTGYLLPQANTQPAK